eukprot:3003398-Amphidinium_carterae.1
MGCSNHACGAHSEWSAVDQKVRCKNCAPLNHRSPLIRIRGSSSVSLTSSESDGSRSEEEQRVIEEVIRSQDFLGMDNFTGRDVDSFHLVDQNSSRSLSSGESEVQGRDLNQPGVTRVQVRAHQRTFHDGRVVVVNIKSHHSRGKGEGRIITFSPERVTRHKGGFKSKG